MKDKSILKWVLIGSVVLTVLVCVGMYLFPTLKEEKEPDQEASQMPEKGVQVEVVAPEDIPTVGAPAEGEEPAWEKDKLNIELPEGIDGRNVKISNDYLNQIVTIRFDKGVDDYPEKYRVYGSSKHISSVSYYMDGEAGVLEIKLDQVCEFSYLYKENFLCVKFMDPHEIYDKVVVVDAGHGGRAVGAVRKGICEKDLNLAIVKEIKELLDDAKNVKVYYTRLDDTNPTLSQRVELANKANADLFISIHHNTASSTGFTDRQGTLVMYNQSDTSEYSGERLAEICLRNINETAGSNRRGFGKGDNLHIIKYSKVPVVLIEVGYMTNLEELAKLQTAEYQKLVAQGVYNAVMEAFEEGF